MGLGARLAIGFAIVGVTTALVVGGASYVTTNRQVTAEIDQFLEQRVDEIKDGQRDEPRDRRDRDSDEQIVVAVSPDAEVQILDAAGDVVSNTGLLLPVEAIDEELADDGGRSFIRTISINDTEYRMITDDLERGGAIQVARSLEESTSLLAALQTRTLVTAVAAACLAAFIGWFVAQRTTRPLRALTTTVDEVARTRDFTVEVPVAGNDEVGRLANGFNRMLGALQRSQHQQKQLVQDAAHELRTPLTSVTANVEWLARVPDLDSETRTETLASVRRELKELNVVVGEIIELATEVHQPAAKVPVDLAHVVDSAVDRFTLRSGRTVDRTTSATPVLADPDALERAVNNLLTNADKYSPTNAPIAVDVSPSGVFVNDAGPGIPPSDRSRVFDRFYRRDEDRSLPGSGLGLSIVANIVEHHGGDLVVADSRLGGASVGFRLPPAHPTNRVPPTASA